MSCQRILEIIEENDGRLSSTRFCVLIGQIIGAIVMMKLTWTDNLTLDMFSAYLVYSGGLYGFNRYQAKTEKVASVMATQPQAATVVPVPVPAPTPPQNININMPPGQSQTQNIPGDANLHVEGDANVNKIVE